MRLSRQCKRGCIVCRSHGNNGNNIDPMVSVRHEPAKHEITGHALLTMQKFIESLDYKPLSEANLRRGAKNIKHGKYKHELEPEPINILVSDLVTGYKWSYQLCHLATFLPIFSDIIVNDVVKIEDVPKFDKLMYKVMGD